MKGAAIITLGLIAAGAAVIAFALKPTQTTPQRTDVKDIYAFKAETIDGKAMPLEKYKGKVLMVVNVASKCGNTPQYAALESLYEKYGEKGLVVMGFPANQFGGQEPGTNAEIQEFCSATYGVKFPMFAKIEVKGENAHPLYQWLVAQTDNKNDIEWNFAKFLVGRDGKVVARFGAREKPDNEKIVAAIESALAAH